MSLTEIELFLKARIGLDTKSIGSSMVARAVERRQRECALPDTDDYEQRLTSSREELQALISLVTVPETWFFRDRGAFTALGEEVCREWIRDPNKEKLRILSVPCSSGEEPFSMAMELIEAGLSPARFHIDAFDINHPVLAQARRGLYSRNSFRGSDLAFRDRHFSQLAGEYLLSDEIRGQVTFAQGNLLEGDFRPPAPAYDVIFCRNVLIYFDAETQARAVGILSGFLKPEGWLFVAPAETALLLRHQFVSTKWPLAFAFRKANKQEQIPVRPAPVRPKAPTPPALSNAVVVRPRVKLEARPRPPVIPERKAIGLETARELADQGRLEEAGRIMSEHLRREGPSAELFYLQALVLEAGNDPQAPALYRKALYLDPGHAEALIHLALVLEKEGDRAGANRLRQRAQRTQTRKF